MSVLQDSARFRIMAWPSRYGRTVRSGKVPGAVNDIGRAIAVAILALTALSIALDARARAGFTITPTFDSSITNDPNAATIEGTINGMIQQYESLITNSVNVTCDVQRNEFRAWRAIGTTRRRLTQTFARAGQRRDQQ